MVTTGMELTFDTLATVANEAADHLLGVALLSDDPAVRSQAISATLRRRTTVGARRILKLWDQLNDAELRAVQDHPQAMKRAVEEILLENQSSPLWNTSLEAMRMLSLHELLPKVIHHIEIAGETPQQRLLLAAVLEMGDELGTEAREGRGRPSVREPVTRRLVESVRHYDFHRCDGLCTALLAASNWGDRQLRVLLDEDMATQKRLQGPLLESTVPGVVQLVAGFIRRKHIPGVVSHAIVTRRDSAFRVALLKAVGTEPTATTLNHLRHMPLLAIFRSSQSLVTQTAVPLHAALALAHSANCKSDVDRVNVLLDLIAIGNHEADAAVAIALAHCEPLDHKLLIQAALAIAGAPDALPPVGEQYRRVIHRVLSFLDHPCRSIVGGLRRVLSGLHAKQFIAGINELPESRLAGIGTIVQQLDENALNTIREELRSPLLERRQRAIKAAKACDFIELLEGALTGLATKDFREVRITALEALAQGKNAASLEALEAAAYGPDGLQRDVAIEAFVERLDDLEQAEPNSAKSQEQANEVRNDT